MIATFLSDKLNKPMIYIRKKPKGFGINKQIEGNFIKNQNAMIIEDLATDGGSKINFIQVLRNNNLKVSDILVIFFYNIFDISKTPLGKMNVKIHSLCTWENIFNVISNNKNYNEKDVDNLKDFLFDPEKWRKNNE